MNRTDYSAYPTVKVPIEVLLSKALSSGAKMLYVLLRYLAVHGPDGLSADFTNRELSEWLSISTTSLYRQKKELKTVGLVKVAPDGSTYVIKLNESLVQRLRVGRKG